MSNIREELKVPTQDEKRTVYVNVIMNMVNSSSVLSIEEVKKKVEGIDKKLSQDEFNAIYSLGVEIKKHIKMPKGEKKILEFLNISEYCENDNGNLMKFMNITLENIREERTLFPKRKWRLQIGKIFDRMEGKNPYVEELKNVSQNRKNNIHILK